jgi:hypothetical protein
LNIEHERLEDARAYVLLRPRLGIVVRVERGVIVDEVLVEEAGNRADVVLEVRRQILARKIVKELDN